MEEKLVFFEKGDVNGATARDVYKWLTKELPNEDGSLDIGWNFGKFLVDRTGAPIKRFSPKAPTADFKPDIEALLSKNAV